MTNPNNIMSSKLGIIINFSSTKTTQNCLGQVIIQRILQPYTANCHSDNKAHEQTSKTKPTTLHFVSARVKTQANNAQLLMSRHKVQFVCQTSIKLQSRMLGGKLGRLVCGAWDQHWACCIPESSGAPACCPALCRVWSHTPVSSTPACWEHKRRAGRSDCGKKRLTLRPLCPQLV